MKQDRLHLNRVAFYGRTLEEYITIFDLDLSLWKGCRILDCPSGASSFAAEAHQLGYDAVGCDPLFGNSFNTLAEQGRKDIEHVIGKTSEVLHLFNWEFYPSINALKKYRTRAFERFCLDYSEGLKENRYIKGSLPQLPFESKSFDLVLSGHFLFTYCDKFDFSFHADSLLELVRVSSKEVRIYPLQGPDAKPYPFMEKILSFLESKGVRARLVPVPFEFQRGSNEMLCLTG